MSSDGGGLLLQAANEKLSLTTALAGCLRDDRQAGKVKHSLEEALRQRVYGIALWYPDANDTPAGSSSPGSSTSTPYGSIDSRTGSLPRNRSESSESESPQNADHVA